MNLKGAKIVIYVHWNQLLDDEIPNVFDRWHDITLEWGNRYIVIGGKDFQQSVWTVKELFRTVLFDCSVEETGSYRQAVQWLTEQGGTV